jgi:beta-glucosidase
MAEVSEETVAQEPLPHDPAAQQAAQLVAAQEAAIEQALARLDLEAKVSVLSGKDMWALPALAEIGLSSVVMSDGPVGVRGTGWSAEDPSIALPSPTALAATWDPALAKQAGRLLGQEAHRKRVHVLLAPTVNLHRTPLGGRHFEAYSEDPLLTGVIGAAYVTGVQEQGIATTVKHFVANDSETDRFTVSSRVGERALRELYLAPFEQIVRAAGAWGVMSAYNAVNGLSMTNNGPLQHGVLKGEWGFDGAVVSDWTAARATVATAAGGLDIAMPAMGNPWGSRLVAAVRDGSVGIEVVDEQVRRVLRLAARVGALAGAPPSVPPSRRPAEQDGRALAREIAARSFVLASNRDGALPLDAATLSSVAVIGSLARDARVLGGGSATVFPEHVTSPLEGLTAALPAGVRLAYAVGADPRTTLAPAAAPRWAGLRATFRDQAGAILHEAALATGAGRWMEMPPGVSAREVATVEIAGRLTADADGVHQLGIRGAGSFTLKAGPATLFDGKVVPDSGDRARQFLAPPEQRVQLTLQAGDSVEVSLAQHVSVTREFAIVSMTLGYGAPIAADDELLAEAERVAAASDVAVVVVGTTEEVESEGFDRTDLRLPGRQDELVSRVAAANPRTIAVINAGSPVELPWADDVAAVLLTWFGGQEAGHALADVLLGAAEPGGRLPTTWPVVAADCPVLSTTPEDGVLPYDEGVFIGYRAWQRSPVAPRYPFGHGQGYTTWDYEEIAVAEAGPGQGAGSAASHRVTVVVRNTGARRGRQVVQVYVAPVDPGDDRPARWLAGFGSVTADPGEAGTVTVELPRRAFQIWDDGWRTVQGQYLIEAAGSVTDVRAAATIAIG